VGGWQNFSTNAVIWILALMISNSCICIHPKYLPLLLNQYWFTRYSTSALILTNEDPISSLYIHTGKLYHASTVCNSRNASGVLSLKRLHVKLISNTGLQNCMVYDLPVWIYVVESWLQTQSYRLTCTSYHLPAWIYIVIASEKKFSLYLKHATAHFDKIFWPSQIILLLFFIFFKKKIIYLQINHRTLQAQILLSEMCINHSLKKTG
jgi:hypothetical protein